MKRVIIGFIGVAVIIAIDIVLLGMVAERNNSSSDLDVVTAATIVITPTTSPLIATPALGIVEPGVTIFNPPVPVGQAFEFPAKDYYLGIKIVRVADSPTLSLQQARQAIYNQGIGWALGGSLQGEAVTLTAAYGLVTIGGPASNGKGWIGPQNLPLSTCDAGGKCTSLGIILPRIENRLMWVLDYGNTKIPANGPPCNTTPCPTQQVYTNSVYTVDVLTGAPVTGNFYTKP